jgi:hypothetical protein
MHMQKALSQMNLQLHHVLSDITGLSGLAILCHHWWRTRSGQARQLVQWARQEPAREGREVFGGDYWPEHLFALRQSLVGLRFYRKLMAEVEVELQLRTREPKAMQVLLELAKYPARSFRKRKSLTALGRRFCMRGICDKRHIVLRRALSDDARCPSLIQTIPKRGYRLMALPVREFRAEVSGASGSLANVRAAQSQCIDLDPSAEVATDD